MLFQPYLRIYLHAFVHMQEAESLLSKPNNIAGIQKLYMTVAMTFNVRIC